MAINYTSYFNKLPRIDYDINGSLINPNTENVTNIFFRIKYMRDILNNTSSYYSFELEDSDTPELLAEKIYGDAGAGWMITLANELIDPQFEWPLDYQSFQKYIIDKYGSLEIAQTTDHHYEMIVQRSLNGDPPVEFKYIINQKKLTKNDLDVPFNFANPYTRLGFWREPEIDYSADTTKFTSDTQGGEPSADSDQDKYTIDEQLTLDRPELTADLVFGKEGKTYAKGALPVSDNGLSYTFDDNYSVRESRFYRGISVYDYEQELNENKRLIKIIKKEYYDQILNEFNVLTGYSPSFVRRVL